MNGAYDEIATWLEQFAASVRQRDIEAGRAMFTTDCLAFGTRNSDLHDLDALVESQWRPTWFNTNGFGFVSNSINIWVSPDHKQASAAAMWTSTAGDNEDGEPRAGRATFILQQDSRWVCVHSHLSYTPSGAL